MPIVVTCGACETRYRMPDSARGRELPCKECGYLMRVPRGSRTDDSAPVRKPPAPRLPARSARSKRRKRRNDGFDFSFNGPLNKIYFFAVLFVAVYISLVIAGFAPHTLPHFLCLGGFGCAGTGFCWAMLLVNGESECGSEGEGIIVVPLAVMLLLVLVNLHRTWPGVTLFLGGIGLIALSRPDQWL